MNNATSPVSQAGNVTYFGTDRFDYALNAAGGLPGVAAGGLQVGQKHLLDGFRTDMQSVEQFVAPFCWLDLFSERAYFAGVRF